MAAVSTLLDAEPVVLEDLNLTPTCDCTGCAEVATWLTFLTCGCAGAVCDKHQQMQAKKDRSNTSYCSWCGQKLIHVARWERL